MKKYLAALAVVVFASTSSFAQTAPAVDPVTAEATRQMFDAMKARDMMVASLETMERALSAQMRQSLTGAIDKDSRLTAQQRKEALAGAEKTLLETQAQMRELFSDGSLIDEMLTELIPVYASIYTLDEIRQLSAFYQSPLGQKMLVSTPRLVPEVMQISSRVLMPRIQKLRAQGPVNKQP